MIDVLLLTDNDLDGAGAAVLANLLVPKDLISKNKLDIIYTGRETDKYVKNILDSKSYINYDRIYIVDTSISDELAQRIDTISYTNKHGQPVMLKDITKVFDHHTGALHLKKYDWCRIEANENGAEMYEHCGCQLFMEDIVWDLEQIYSPNQLEEIGKFIDGIRMYDTWEWKKLDRHDIMLANMNFLSYANTDIFVREMVRIFNTSNKLPLIPDLSVRQLLKRELEMEISLRNKALIVRDIDGHRVGLVYCNRFKSEVGNALCEKNKDLDYIALWNENTVSLRTQKDNLNLSEIAKRLNGNGRAKTAGFVLKDNHLDGTIDNIVKLLLTPIPIRVNKKDNEIPKNSDVNEPKSGVVHGTTSSKPNMKVFDEIADPIPDEIIRTEKARQNKNKKSNQGHNNQHRQPNGQYRDLINQ